MDTINVDNIRQLKKILFRRFVNKAIEEERRLANWQRFLIEVGIAYFWLEEMQLQRCDFALQTKMKTKLFLDLWWLQNKFQACMQTQQALLFWHVGFSILVQFRALHGGQVP